MLTLNEIKEELQDRNLVKVAEGSGVNYNALCRLINGKTKPMYDTVEKLSNYLEGKK